MSDEERQPQPVGSVRPAGKRQISGVSTTSSDAYAAKKAVAAQQVDPDELSGKPLSRKVLDYIPETVQEMRKVIWPTAKQMLIYTLIVFAFLISLTALVWGVDTLTGLGVEKIFGQKPQF